ncbi:MAG TPA: hypothetical protein VHQ45_00190 [Gemmatimonadaceae bacterium]|nr:hypothetical protein [Gemmatimonadaceae bacterium]
MRQLLSFIVTALAIGGCAHVPPAGSDFAPGASKAPLQARVFPPYYGRISFSVNKPAYVALFEVAPGQGISLVYPLSGQPQRVQHEVTWQSLSFVPQRWLYTNASLSGPVGGPARYFYLIASERPLDIARLQRDAGSLRRTLDINRYAAIRPYDTMEDLAFMVVPRIEDDRWTTDVFADWGYDWGYGGSTLAFAPSSLYRSVICQSGQVRFASWWQITNPCTGRDPWYQQLAVYGIAPTAPYPGYPVYPGDPGNPVPPVPADSAKRTRVPAGGSGGMDGRTRLGPTEASALLAGPQRRRWDAAVSTAIKSAVTSRQAETGPLHRSRPLRSSGVAPQGRTRVSSPSEPGVRPSSTSGRESSAGGSPAAGSSAGGSSAGSSAGSSSAGRTRQSEPASAPASEPASAPASPGRTRTP